MSRHPPIERKCHHTGFSQSCRDLVNTGACGKWQMLIGKNPQPPGEEFSSWDCVDVHEHTLRIDQNKHVVSMAAAFEEMRNQVAVGNSNMAAVIEAVTKVALLSPAMPMHSLSAPQPIQIEHNQ